MATLSPGGTGTYSFKITPKSKNTKTTQIWENIRIADVRTFSAGGVSATLAATQEPLPFLTIKKVYYNGKSSEPISISGDTYYIEPTFASATDLIVEYETNYPSGVYMVDPTDKKFYTSSEVSETNKTLTLYGLKNNEASNVKNLVLTFHVNGATTTTDIPTSSAPDQAEILVTLSITQKSNDDIVEIDVNPEVYTFVPSGGTFNITSIRKITSVNYTLEFSTNSGNTTYSIATTGASTAWTTSKQLKVTHTSENATITVTVAASTTSSDNVVKVKVFDINGQGYKGNSRGNLTNVDKTFTVKKRVLTISPTTGLEFSPTGGTSAITVTSNVPWTATKTGDFITLAATTGGSYSTTEASVSINATVSTYTGTTQRSGSITFKDNGLSSNTKTENVKQSGTAITVDPTSAKFFFFESGSTYAKTFTVESNVNYIIEYDENKWTITKV